MISNSALQMQEDWSHTNVRLDSRMTLTCDLLARWADTCKTNSYLIDARTSNYSNPLLWGSLPTALQFISFAVLKLGCWCPLSVFAAIALLSFVSSRLPLGRVFLWWHPVILCDGSVCCLCVCCVLPSNLRIKKSWKTRPLHRLAWQFLLRVLVPLLLMLKSFDVGGVFVGHVDCWYLLALFFPLVAVGPVDVEVVDDVLFPVIFSC